MQCQHITNIILLKEPGNYKINRLQVIHIYEHDYNPILAPKRRALIKHSVQNNLLHHSQYGRIPGWTSEQPTLIEEFQNEICRTSRQPLVMLQSHQPKHQNFSTHK